jgi:hypothetical protein
VVAARFGSAAISKAAAPSLALKCRKTTPSAPPRCGPTPTPGSLRGVMNSWNQP